MLSLIRPPNGITERAREVLALLCNPTLYTRHSFQPTTPSGTTSPTFHPNSLVSTRIPGGIRLAFASLGRCWSEGCGRRLGDLRSDFKLYLGMDRSIYLGGVSAIMHGLTVSVAAKLTPLRRAAVPPFFDRVEEEEEERDLEFRNDRNFPEFSFSFFSCLRFENRT